MQPGIEDDICSLLKHGLKLFAGAWRALSSDIEPNGMSIASDQAAADDGSSEKRRRAAARHVREVRSRLTSSTGTRPAFDYELLRLFAQNRLSASLVILLLVGTVGLLSSLWTGALKAGTWTSAVLMIHAVIVNKCRQFLNESPSRVNIRGARLHFILLDLFFGLSWMFILIRPLGVEEGSGTFMLFVMLLVVAMSSMLERASSGGAGASPSRFRQPGEHAAPAAFQVTGGRQHRASSDLAPDRRPGRRSVCPAAAE
jgi:hypothetical protein